MSEPVSLLAPLRPQQLSPRLWRDGRFEADDWIAIADDGPIPVVGRVIVSLPRWRAERALINRPADGVGIRADVASTIDPIGDEIERLGLVALSFPKFSDGRSYSTARRLREAGFAGEIRATGDVLLDQLPLMLRSGFDAFEIGSAATVTALERGAVPAISRVYQSGAETRAYRFSARRAGGGR
jgi:uncharacterized protein (DUF934 family)